MKIYYNQGTKEGLVMDNVKRILVPIDSSEIAERAMQQAIKINRFNEA